MAPKDYYSTAEVAKKLGFHPETIREMIREGYIPAVKIRGRYRISHKELERLLKEKRTPH